LFQGTAAARNPTWSWTGSNEAAASMATFLTSGGGGGSRPVKMVGPWGGFAGSSGGFAG
jgi:hypothetical protein